VAKVTGIGGVFFKAKSDKKTLSTWYQKNLGISLEDFGGAIFKWPEDTAEDEGLTVWCLDDPKTEWFSPSQSDFMINYRIDSMASMIEQLKNNGVEIIEGPQNHENGQFAWIMDPDGNKIELWEPAVWNANNKHEQQ
jgi:predicted enzyme related to lactoylglutathione lyase